MLCSRCGKNFADKRISGENGETLYLCGDCYLSLFSARGKSAKADVCPNCGTTLEEFRRTGLLGCAECYRTFRGEVALFLERTQGGSRHVGKVQHGEEEKYVRTRELVREHDQVKEELERALLDGDFEVADELKTRLKELHRTLYPKGEKQ